MELRHIKYFLAVAEELHFGRAAKKVHTTQPPLSLQIKQLEHELGAQLFDRTKRRVEISPAGAALLPHAKALLEQAQLCADVVRLSAQGATGTIRIGYVEEAVHFVFPDVLGKFQSQYPGVKLELIEMHSTDQIAALEAGKIDFGFGYSVSKSTALASKAVLKGSILIAIPEGHPLSKHSAIDLSQCDRESFIFPSRSASPQLFDLLLAVCHASEFVPRIGYTAEHIYTVMGLVRAGLGVTLFPEFLMPDEWVGTCVRPLRGRKFSLQMQVHWIKNRAHWAPHQNFLRAVGVRPEATRKTSPHSSKT